MALLGEAHMELVERKQQLEEEVVEHKLEVRVHIQLVMLGHN